ncbi:MAG: S1 RNA-binding domain-containing protein, partial [Clostridia bacterium]|nr:S1 RNA-binding domain-containing protein [Clostridia bacterium]
DLKELPAKIKEYGENKAAEYCGLDKATMNDIVTELLKPGRDIRDSLPAPVLRKDIMSIEDLSVGMEVEGSVRNVIDFGAFIDIGVHQDGLVHVSEITDRYIKHPSDVLKVGQKVKAVIISLDVKKQRIGLSIKQLAKKEAK